MASRQHQQLLLPAIHISSSLTHQAPSASRQRHCDDPDCFIWTRTTQAERWAAFDSFHPREIEQDYTRVVASPSSNASSSDSEDDFLHSLKERRIRRAAELRTRAKARLMPSFDHSTRQTRRMQMHHVVGGGGCGPSTPERVSPRSHYAALTSTSSTPIARDRRLLYRTPSPPPMSVRRASSPSTPRTPRLPTTPMTPAHTPASTVAHRSPVPTPHLPMCLNSPSP
ncbi:hypothetical protein M407DRAFT_16569 [Tulasnella calospora MUT 4182]|uniref:Uncharacterized protein n=1 Tax=Tulasnella calospora MUT 4182 TaxID=1051891 RepID=A0A0C3QN63_9AGAM|nr:hypothetical protein M407DRAFT_16569 [Tulasnella calospora MUT 4182]